MLPFLEKIFKAIYNFDEKSFREYLKNLGLAAVIGSLTGFLLRPHNHHQLTSLFYLLTIGIVTSYFGVRKNKK